ncbi:MAG: hypothetical protein WD766_14515 [Gemmatimonadota bacterium]
MRHFLIALVGCLLTVDPGSAQGLTITGEAGDSATAILAGIVERGGYLLIDRDTVLADDTRIRSDVVIVDARVALEGVIEGAVAVVRADFFIRPGASVPGPIAVIDGGAYPSGLAEVGDIVEMDRRIAADLAPAGPDHSIALTPPTGPGLLRLGPIFGLGAPSYDRVNGLSLSLAVELASAGDTAAISLQPSATYYAARGELGGGARLTVRPSRRSMLAVQVERSARTNDRWIRGDLENSLSAILVRSDIRDYYETDAVSATIARTPPPPLIEGEGFVAPYLTIQASRDRSLATHEPWSLLGDDDWRLNPAADEGVLGSVAAGASAGWRGIFSRFSGDLALEWAPGVFGDFEFAQVRADAAWDMVALYQHRIAVSGHLALPLTGDEAPLQRWSFVGGPGTLPAHSDAAFRGDHVLFVESAYTAPIVWLPLPLAGPPSLRLVHSAGIAWRTGVSMPPIEQNLGLGVQIMIFDAMVYLDPARSVDPAFSIGARLPAGGLSF